MALPERSQLTYDDDCLFPAGGRRHEVDPDAGMIEVKRKHEGKLETVAELGAERGDRLASPLLPGLDLEIEACFT